jgi:hypothetical protein
MIWAHDFEVFQLINVRLSNELELITISLRATMTRLHSLINHSLAYDEQCGGGL